MIGPESKAGLYAGWFFFGPNQFIGFRPQWARCSCAQEVLGPKSFGLSRSERLALTTNAAKAANGRVVPEMPVVGPQMAANGSPWQVLRPVVGCQFPVASCRLPHHSPLTTDHSPLTTHQLVVLCQLPHDSRLTTHQSVLRCQLSVATPLTSLAASCTLFVVSPLAGQLSVATPLTTHRSGCQLPCPRRS
jgi:hypothetical protein